MSDKVQRTRERAHQIWEQEGRGTEHWLEVEPDCTRASMWKPRRRVGVRTQDEALDAEQSAQELGRGNDLSEKPEGE